MLFDYPFKRFVDFPSETQIKGVEDIINRYCHFYIESGTEDDIMWAFTSEKPVTSIRILQEEQKEVKQLVKDLKPFFFVGQGYVEPSPRLNELSTEIFVSRYEILADIISSYSRNGEDGHGNFSDLEAKSFLFIAPYFLLTEFIENDFKMENLELFNSFVYNVKGSQKKTCYRHSKTSN